MDWHPDKLQNGDGDIIDAMVAREGKVFANREVRVLFANVVEMVFESIYDGTSGLAYILHATLFAGDGVDEVVGSTCCVYNIRILHFLSTSGLL